jgi:hypothetical protein
MYHARYTTQVLKALESPRNVYASRFQGTADPRAVSASPLANTVITALNTTLGPTPPSMPILSRQSHRPGEHSMHKLDIVAADIVEVDGMKAHVEPNMCGVVSL